MTDGNETMTDEQLAQRAQGGDWASFDELVSRFEARIYRFAFNCCGHETDAREIAQETFVTAYFQIKRFDPARSMATWLFTIARRKGIDRSRRARPLFTDEMPELPDMDDPSVLMARREATAVIWRVARRVLPDLQFQALWLRYDEDLTVLETAQVLCRTQMHVKVILFRARAKLAREVERIAEVERASSRPVALGTSTATKPETHLEAAVAKRAL